MATCTSCGKWAGRSDEPCPNCHASPRAKSAPLPPGAKKRVSPVDAFLEDTGETTDLPAPPSSRGTPSPAEFERWYTALEQSPVFASDDPARSESTTAPVLEPLPPASGAAPVLEPVAPVLAPLPAVAPALRFEDGARDDGVREDARAVDISAAFELPSTPNDDEPLVNLLVSLDASGAPLLDPAREPLAHVILVLDVSASMNRTDKYPLLTQAIEGMLWDLKRSGAPDVLLSVVVYAYGSEVVFRDRPTSRIDPREVLREIDRSSLRFGRYTDMAGALKNAALIARDQIRAHKAMPVRICVLTDGRPQDLDRTRHVLEVIRSMPVDVDGLAFGSDADVAILQDLVQGGRGGTVKHIRPDTIGEAFGRIAETISRVVANRAIFEFELARGVAGGAAYRYRPARHRYGDAAFEGGRRFRTDLGTIETGRRYSLLFQLRLPASAATETEVGRITVRLPAYGGARCFEAHLSMARHRGRVAFTPDREVQAAHDVLAALGAADPSDQLRALRARRRLYEAERRDPVLLDAIDRAIGELEETGTLARLSKDEQAVILSHTCTAGGLRPEAARAGA